MFAAAPTKGIKSIAEIPAKEDDEPIVPQAQMSVQLSTSEPPVGDAEYIPASVSDLSLAAAVIARETPSSQIEFLYRNLHKLLDRALDREKERRTGQIARDTGIVLNHDMIEIEKEMENDRQEMALREAVSRFLFEQSAVFSPEEAESSSDAAQRILDYLRSTNFDKSGEIQLTDAIKSLLNEESIFAVMYDGEKFDCGSKKGFVHATIALALRDESISKDIKNIIKDII